MKLNADNNEVMVLGGKEGSVCVAFVDGIELEHVSKAKCLWCFG